MVIGHPNLLQYYMGMHPKVLPDIWTAHNMAMFHVPLSFIGFGKKVGLDGLDIP